MGEGGNAGRAVARGRQQCGESSNVGQTTQGGQQREADDAMRVVGRWHGEDDGVRRVATQGV